MNWDNRPAAGAMVPSTYLSAHRVGANRPSIRILFAQRKGIGIAFHGKDDLYGVAALNDDEVPPGLEIRSYVKCKRAGPVGPDLISTLVLSLRHDRRVLCIAHHVLSPHVPSAVESIETTDGEGHAAAPRDGVKSISIVERRVAEIVPYSAAGLSSQITRQKQADYD